LLGSVLLTSICPEISVLISVIDGAKSGCAGCRAFEVDVGKGGDVGGSGHVLVDGMSTVAANGTNLMSRSTATLCLLGQ